MKNPVKALDLLASTLNHKDDVPNQQLADLIIANQNGEWVKELAGLLNSKDKIIQSDSIKVLYEIGERGHAKLIAPHFDVFIGMLRSKNNRLVWGAMVAINTIALLKTEALFANLTSIQTAMKAGSVITIDGGISVLAKLVSVQKYQQRVMPILIEQLAICPAKQFPMYIEKSEIAFNQSTRQDFLGIIEVRYKDLDKESQRKRVDKMRKKLTV